MKKFRDKTQGFILGIMVGLIVAGGFFVLKLDDYFKELNFYKTFIHTFTSEHKTADANDDKKEAAPENEKLTSKNNSGSKLTSMNDSLRSNKLNTDLDVNEDSLYASLTSDTLYEKTMNTSEEVVVRKDELVATKTFEVINLNPTASRTTNSKDSLLQRVSGVVDDKVNGKQLFNIEFWQSPLNYKGYKLSKYKMILYGMPSENDIKVFKLEDNIYLKNMAMVYKLEYASDFKSYERVTDENIISKLK